MARHDDMFHALSACAALVGAMSIQIGTNFCNDYFDFFQGADAENRKGPTRAVQAGLISPPRMLWATMLMFSLTAIISVYMFMRAGWPFLIIGSLSILCGVLYTAGRYSLAYMGWGDPFVLVFFGPVAVGGTYYLQALSLPRPVVLAGFAPGLLSVGLLVVNNLRDIDEDRAAHKRTLAVRFGATFSRLQYSLCVVLAAGVPILLWFDGQSAGLLIACAVFVPGLLVTRKVWQGTGAQLRPCLGMTAGLLLVYTLLFCFGLSI